MAKTANKGAAASDKPKEKKLPQKKVRVRNQVKKGPHGGTLVVLVDDTAHVGKQGEIVEVKAGYARNYLIPYGKAVAPAPKTCARSSSTRSRSRRPARPRSRTSRCSRSSSPGSRP